MIAHLEKRLLNPAWLEVLMDQLIARRDEWGDRAPPARRRNGTPGDGG
jgi:hypothetical protein